MAQTHGNKQENSIDNSHNVDKTSIHPHEELKVKDRIERFPGQPYVKFSQYGGYVTVDTSAGRAFYYYFVEAQHSKESLPLLLWLNGGIICTKIDYQKFQEILKEFISYF